MVYTQGKGGGKGAVDQEQQSKANETWALEQGKGDKAKSSEVKCRMVQPRYCLR